MDLVCRIPEYIYGAVSFKNPCDMSGGNKVEISNGAFGVKIFKRIEKKIKTEYAAVANKNQRVTFENKACS